MSTAIEEYFGGIVSGDIVACEKMRLIAAKMLDHYHNPGEYHFDREAAYRHIDFIEQFCYLPAGRRGVPFKLELFQRAILEVVFGFVDENGLRQYQEFLLIIGRKNGKTSLLSAIELDMLINDDEFAPEVYNVATKLDQAKKGFDNCQKMLAQSPTLKRHIRKRAADLYHARSMGIIKALASNTNTMDSLDVSCGVVDELAAIKNRDLYDLVKQGMSARLQPLLACITTNGFVRDNIFDSQYEYATKWIYDKLEEPDDRFVAFIYELDDRSEWDNPEAWIKANPGLGTIKGTDKLAGYVAKAKSDAAFKPTVMVKDFNLIENTATAWLTWSDIEQVEPDPEDPSKRRPITFDFSEMGFRYGIGGFDAADSVDLNFATALCQRRLPDDTIDPRIYVRAMVWLPESVLDTVAASGNRRERDDVPYLLWERKGLLRTYPGNKVDKRVFLDWYKELRDEEDLYFYRIGYDPWHIDDSLLAEFEAEFGKSVMVRVRQGAFTMSDPLKELKADLKANLFPSNHHPILNWCMSNAQVRSDINENIQLVKASDPRKRIDGLVALANGFIVWRDNRDDYHALL